jgi:hypothetical protein
MTNNKETTVLITTKFDSKYIIELCLETIRQYSTYPYRIIVGNNGTDEETRIYLSAQKDIGLVDIPETYLNTPKDYLASLVKTDYHLFLHDDVQILKSGWLERRVKVMERRDNNAIVGEIGLNYGAKFPFYIFKSKLRRFFPMGMLVKTAAAKELNLSWGIVKDKFDTGGYAYQQFLAQKKWKFQHFPFKYDIRHFGEMTWPVKKKLKNEKTPLELDKLIEIRKQKLEMVKEILNKQKHHTQY